MISLNAIGLKYLTEHNVIWCFAMHVLSVKFTGEDLCIPSTTVNVLFVFDRELNDQIFSFIGELYANEHISYYRMLKKQSDIGSYKGCFKTLFYNLYLLKFC